jgi:WD40 repeat protein
MLRRVAFTELPRDAQSVRVLHHISGGVVIAAVAYKPVITAASPQSKSSTQLCLSSATKSARHARTPLFFTVVEMPAPNERGLPLRVVHVRVPAPATVVNSVTLLCSSDGKDMYVVVQAAEADEQHPNQQLPQSVITYVYRRQEVRAKDAAAEECDDDDSNEEDVDSTSAAVAAAGGVGCASDAMRVRYQRLPRPVAGGDGALWTAARACSATATLLTASETARADTVDDGVAPVLPENQLQLWTLNGTRMVLTATWRIPALSGFPISQILTVPGTQDVALVRCGNTVAEVDLGAVRSACGRYPHTVATNSFLTRAWRLSPHARLTACATKDALLYAGTEDGTVVLWDLRKPTTSAAATALDKEGGLGGVAALPPCSTCQASRAPVTGLYAPYATGFISCDASGVVRDWRERSDTAEQNNDDDNANPSQLHNRSSSRSMEDEEQLRGGLRSAAAAFPYRARRSAGGLGELTGCVAMDGDDNFVAVVSEFGQLHLLFCT